MNPGNPDDLFGPATGTERRTWQLRAHAALATVLSRAAAAGLDPVTWTLTDLGGLYGRINEYGRVLTEDQARERFARWAEFLDLSENPRTARTGRRIRRGRAQRLPARPLRPGRARPGQRGVLSHAFARGPVGDPRPRHPRKRTYRPRTTRKDGAMTTATTPRVWLAAAPCATPADRPVVRDQMGRRWQPENHTDSYRTADGRHHADWRELHALFDLVEVTP